jgi:hypothetical protein
MSSCAAEGGGSPGPRRGPGVAARRAGVEGSAGAGQSLSCAWRPQISNVQADGGAAARQAQAQAVILHAVARRGTRLCVARCGGGARELICHSVSRLEIVGVPLRKQSLPSRGHHIAAIVVREEAPPALRPPAASAKEHRARTKQEGVKHAPETRCARRGAAAARPAAPARRRRRRARTRGAARGESSSAHDDASDTNLTQRRLMAPETRLRGAEVLTPRPRTRRHAAV